MKLSLKSALWAGLVLVATATGAANAADPGVVQIPSQSTAGGIEPVIFWGSRNCYNGYCNGCSRCRHGLANGAAFVRPPSNWPLHRVPNTYQHYWSAEMGGAPRGRYPQLPMVYQPTDTTQSGFYYTTTPRWHSRPEMLPPAPLPNWPLGMHRSYNPGYYAAYAPGYVVNGAVVADPAPAQENQILVPQPEAAPQAPAPVVVP